MQALRERATHPVSRRLREKMHTSERRDWCAFLAETPPPGEHLPRQGARLQVRLGGRYAPRQAPQPNFLLRLHTSGGAHGAAAEHLLQSDVTSLRRLTSELEAALAEDKSMHSRRIGRRL